MTDATETGSPVGKKTLQVTRRQAVALTGAFIANPAVATATEISPQGDSVVAGGPVSSMSLQNLRCEYRVNPIGIDVVHPRLSWTISGIGRGVKQASYQILVASSTEELARGHGDLWDSGRVKTDRSSGIVYAGRVLASRSRCYWKVRVWDQAGKPTEWSESASWMIGFLSASDWKAHWISDADLANPANRPRTPIHCYRSEIARSRDAVKWIVLDLGASKTFDSISLNPAKPDGTNGDIATVFYPVRFKIEASDSPDFHEARKIVDRTARNVRPPRPHFTKVERYRFPNVSARYVRLTVTRLSLWDGNDYVLGLGRFQVFNEEIDIAIGAHAKASDSIETDQWSARFLTDPQAKVAYAPIPNILPPKMDASSFVSRVPMLRREFQIEGLVHSATLYCSARGFYEARLNGKPVSEDLLAPGYTEYDRLLEYQAYNVTGLLQSGANVIGALLGYGWYAGHMNINDNQYLYGYFPQLLAQLEIEYVDGRRETICGDETWKTTLDGPVRWSDLIDGEGYDCRQELPGWDTPQFDASKWKKATTIRRDKTPIAWQRAQPVRRMQELKPVGVTHISPDVAVYDMGQELAGYCRLNVGGSAGARITLKHAEQRHVDGSINRDSLWGTPAEEHYILDGKGRRTLEPHFTYHGFRFVEVARLARLTKVISLVGVHVRTDARQVGQFECSNPLFNKLMSASRWTQQNMMFDVPAGCAGRSERLSWTGDIRPCVQTALFHFDSAAFFEKYAADLRASQSDEGRFTDICPHAHLRDTDTCIGSPGWADAGVSLPWELYLNTGDVRILSDHFKAACNWVDYVHKNNPDLIWSKSLGMAWGDWLSAGAATPMEIGATAFFANNADIVSRMAEILGRKADAVRYKALFQGIRAEFAHRFVTPNGIIGMPSRSYNVAGLVRSLVKSQNLNFKVNNTTLGNDPAPNALKMLSLTYKIGGLTETKEFDEDAIVDLSGNGQALEIVSAIYGEKSPDPATRDVQGSYALALQFGLLDEPLRSRAAARLAQVVERDGGHPTTGFWSSIELLKALSDHGHHEIAARMVNLTSVPSWGHMVEGDGTTFWESFTADTRNLSLNHWTHSAIGEWLWRHVAGIALDEAQPGYQSVIIRPRPSPEVNECKASYESLRGPISMEWKQESAKFILNVTIPANMSATVFIPAMASAQVMEGSRPAAESPGVHLLRHEAENHVFQIGSGAYQFTAG